jgi:hypothetical protein
MKDQAAEAARNRVLASFEDAHRSHCVDVFVRDDGSFGFETFRSESDGSGRWQCLQQFSHLVFDSGEQALRSAQERVAWLSRSETWRW